MGMKLAKTCLLVFILSVSAVVFEVVVDDWEGDEPSKRATWAARIAVASFVAAIFALGYAVWE